MMWIFGYSINDIPFLTEIYDFDYSVRCGEKCTRMYSPMRPVAKIPNKMNLLYLSFLISALS
jgi:hypothetical protein